MKNLRLGLLKIKIRKVKTSPSTAGGMHLTPGEGSKGLLKIKSRKVKTSPSTAGGMRLTPGEGRKILHAAQSCKKN